MILSDRVNGKIRWFIILNSNITGISNNLDDIQKALNPVKSTVVDNADTNILNSVNLVVWGPESYSTPYKTGNTVYGNGFCITYSTGDQWLCQLAMAVGDSNLFTRHRRLGVWSGWTTKWLFHKIIWPSPTVFSVSCSYNSAWCTYHYLAHSFWSRTIIRTWRNARNPLIP